LTSHRQKAQREYHNEQKSVSTLLHIHLAPIRNLSLDFYPSRPG
jgi:hypothetical protein